MSLAAACGWTLARGLATLILAIPLCRLLSQQLQSLGGRSRRWMWAGLLIPFLTPELMVGYSYSNYFLSLVHHPFLNELLYAVLLAMQLVPIGTAMIYFAPPTEPSAHAIHCRRLAFRSNNGFCNRWLEIIRLQIRGPFRAMLPAFTVMFLLSFQEFEIASLMQATTWTVWLFDAQAGGLFLADTLDLAVLPIVCETAVILPVVVLVLKNGQLTAGANGIGRPLSLRVQLCLWFYLSIAAVVVFGVPIVIAGPEALAGAGRLIESRNQAVGLMKEILTGFAFAVCSGTVAYGLTSCFFRNRGSGWRQHTRIAMAALVSFPGLLGSLVLSLCTLSLFQQSWLNPVYDTPLPMFLALVLFLLPRAMLIRVLLLSVYRGQTQHSASLLQRSPSVAHRDRGRLLKWQMQYRGHFWGAVLLCYWGYWDLTTAVILSPVGVTSAPVRLYNLMHYGQNAVLSAMTALTVAAPLLLLALAASVRQHFLRRLLL